MFTFAASTVNTASVSWTYIQNWLLTDLENQKYSEIYVLKLLNCCTYFHADWAVRAVESSAHWGVDPCLPYFPQALPVPALPALPKAHPRKNKQCTHLNSGTCVLAGIILIHDHSKKQNQFFCFRIFNGKGWNNKRTSSNVSLAGLEMASLISWAKSCCSAISCIMSSILSMSLKEQKQTRRVKTWKLAEDQDFYLLFCNIGEILTWFCARSPRPWKRSPYSSGLLCLYASSPELPSGTQWWRVSHQSGSAAAPGASSFSGPWGQLIERRCTIHSPQLGWVLSSNTHKFLHSVYFWPLPGDSTGTAAPVWRNRLDSRCATHEADQYRLLLKTEGILQL